MFGDYPKSIVDLATDPRTGIAAKCKFLPAVAEVKEFCDAAAARQERLARYDALPKMKRVVGPAPKAEPNLFVPDSSHRYAAMLRLHEKHGGERSRFDTRVCADGVSRAGLWVQLDWWDDPAAAGDDAFAKGAQKFFEKVCQEAGIDPARGVSPVLLANLEERKHDAA